MDENDTNEVVVDLGVKHQLLITVLASIGGFLASKLVEKAYVETVTHVRRNRPTALEQ